jgi:stalled ribosome rescue protein Dom34
MSFQHAVAWIDHAEAHLIHFNPETSDTAVIRSHAGNPHLHTKSAGGTGRQAESAQYFEAVADGLMQATEILLVGPGMEKLELMKYLLKHHPSIAERVMSVETVDHPTDGQLLKHARKYFLRADNML